MAVSGQPVGGRKILLVDDEALIAMAEQATLERNGYSVVTALNAERAIDTAVNDSSIDLVLMDIDLGAGMDGTEAASAILRGRDIPIVFLSAHTEPEIVARTEGITSYGYIVKTSGETVLLASLRMAFRLLRARSSELEAREAIGRQNRFLDYYRAAIDGMPDHAVAIVDEDYRLRIANGPFRERFGPAADDPTGLPVAAVLGDGLFRGPVKGGLDRALAGERTDFSDWFSLPSGESRYLRGLFYPMVLRDVTTPSVVMVLRDYTAERLAEEALDRERAILNSIVDTIPVMITRYDPQKQVLYLNREFEKKIGWSTADMRDVDLMTEVYPDPDYRREVAQYMQRAASEWRRFDVRAKDGSVVVSEWSNIRLPDGTQIGIGLDVTDRVDAERTLADQSSYLQAVVDTTSDGFIVVDMSFRILRVNDAYCTMTGYSRDELLRMTISDLEMEESVQDIRAHVRALAASGSQVFETRHRRKDGTGLDVEVLASYTSPHDDHFVAFIRDISGRKAAEIGRRALASAGQQLNAFTATNVDYGAIVETARTISGADSVRLTVFGPDGGEPLVVDRAREPGDDAPDEPPDMTVLAARDDRVLGSFEFRLANGGRLRNQPLAELYGDMVGMVLYRIETERKNLELVRAKETMLKEVQHRMKNTMNTMASLLALQAGSLSDPAAVAALSDMQTRFRSMEILYGQLYQTDTHDRGSLRDYLEQLVRQVVGLFPGRESVSVLTDVIDLELPVQRLSTLGMIVNELVTNAMKYAYRGRDGGSLRVVADRQAATVTVTVADDGDGLPAGHESDARKSFGLTMVEALVQQLDGTIRYERDEWTRFVVEFDDQPTRDAAGYAIPPTRSPAR